MGKYRRGSFPIYVSVSDRKLQSEKAIQKRRKRGEILNPISIEGRTIAHTFWGKAWCKHIEKFQDYAYRLERGRSYLRSGCVIDLTITYGIVKAIVLGKIPYNVTITIKPLPEQRWQNIKEAAAGRIDSIIALLQGTLPKTLMEKMTDVSEGLFPDVKEISLACTCPDGAVMCKHVAAAMYGVGSRLDSTPEALFMLRSVNHLDLMQAQTVDELIGSTPTSELDNDLSDIFGIELVNAKPGKK